MDHKQIKLGGFERNLPIPIQWFTNDGSTYFDESSHQLNMTNFLNQTMYAHNFHGQFMTPSSHANHKFHLHIYNYKLHNP